MRNYTTTMGRPYLSSHDQLDDIQKDHKSGGIVDMWTNVGLSYTLLKQLMKNTGRQYKLVLKTRPDIVYFTPLLMDSLLANYSRLGLYNPFYDFKDGKPIDEEKYPPERLLPPHAEPLAGPPLFFPQCGGFGGVTDRLFVGPIDHMDVVMSDSWLANLISINITMATELRKNIAPYLWPAKDYRGGHGTEQLLMTWVMWNHLPLASIPFQSNLKFNFGILRPTAISQYCNGKYLEGAHWTHSICVLVHPRHGDLVTKGSQLGHGFKKACSIYLHNKANNETIPINDILSQ